MKIMILDHEIKDKSNLGVPFLIKVLFKGLAAKGYKPTIITSKEKADNYQIQNANIIDIPFTDIKKIVNGTIAIRKFGNHDLFHTHTSGSHVNFDMREFNGRWVATCHGSDLEDAAAEFIVFVSKSQMFRHCERFNSHLRSKNMYLAYNCYQSGLEYRSGTHNKLTYLGVLRKDKGIHLLPEIAKLAGRAIHIYGPVLTYDKEYVEKSLSKHLGYSIHYHGPIDTLDQKNKIFSEAELLVHPAIFHEPFGITLIESAACGVPFIGFNHGSLPELNIDKNLLGNNVDDLGEIIRQKKHKKYSPEDLINYAKSFSEENFVRRYEAIYKDSLSFTYG